MGFLRAAVTKHAFGTVQTKAYIHGARLLRRRLAAQQSEDCLYLNVRTASPSLVGQREQSTIVPGSEPGGSVGGGSSGSPKCADNGQQTDAGVRKAPETQLLPVIVYIHGGDYHDGAGGSRPFYAANALPLKGRVVLVTFNYRLGLFGHFTHPELSKEAEAEGRAAVSGNYGILDQVNRGRRRLSQRDVFPQCTGFTSVKRHSRFATVPELTRLLKVSLLFRFLSCIAMKVMSRRTRSCPVTHRNPPFVVPCLADRRVALGTTEHQVIWRQPG